MRMPGTSEPRLTLPQMWGGWVLLVMGLLAISPVLAQDGVNIKKVGEAAAGGTKDSIENSNSAQAAEGAVKAEAEAPKAEGGTAAAPAEPKVDPNAPPPDVSKYDQYYTAKKKISPEETKALYERAAAFMKYHLTPNETDVRQMTAFAGGRVPWASRAPRTNPYDPQIVKPLPFHQLILDSTPPPPYYPPAGGLKMQSLQEAFQRFLDASKLSGIITTDAGRTAIIVFGKKSVRLKVGGEFAEKDYTIIVKDITADTVVVKTAEGELSGILTLDSAANLLVDSSETGLIIVSDEEAEKKKK